MSAIFVNYQPEPNNWNYIWEDYKINFCSQHCIIYLKININTIAVEKSIIENIWFKWKLNAPWQMVIIFFRQHLIWKDLEYALWFKVERIWEIWCTYQPMNKKRQWFPIIAIQVAINKFLENPKQDANNFK